MPSNAPIKKAGSYLLDPRASLFCAIILTIVIACLSSLPASLLALAASTILLAASRPPLAALRSRFFAVNIFILCMWLIAPWTTPGPRLWPDWPASAAGLRLCLLITIKANAILAVFTSFLLNIPMTVLAAALRCFRLPASLLWLFLLMERNVAAIAAQWRKLEDAAKLRGFSPAANQHTYQTLAALVALLFLGAHTRGERMRDAMLLRGFDGSMPLAAPLAPLSAHDLIAAILSIAGGAALLCLNHIYD